MRPEHAAGIRRQVILFLVSFIMILPITTMMYYLGRSFLETIAVITLPCLFFQAWAKRKFLP